MIELAAILALCLMAAFIVSALVYVERTFLKARTELERSWVTLVHHQQATIEELRNRLMTHTWQDYHNVQTHTPQAQDRVSPTVLPNIPRVSQEDEETTREDLERALSEAGLDLEGSDNWQTTVG